MHNITYRTLAAGVAIAIAFLTLYAGAQSPIARPFWWPIALSAAAETWSLSEVCRCEQSFAVDLEPDHILIRRLASPTLSKFVSQFPKLRPNTVAVFHTHLDDSTPSPEDKEIEKKFRIPFYVIHADLIVECK